MGSPRETLLDGLRPGASGKDHFSGQMMTADMIPPSAQAIVPTTASRREIRGAGWPISLSMTDTTSSTAQEALRTGKVQMMRGIFLSFLFATILALVSVQRARASAHAAGSVQA